MDHQKQKRRKSTLYTSSGRVFRLSASLLLVLSLGCRFVSMLACIFFDMYLCYFIEIA